VATLLAAGLLTASAGSAFAVTDLPVTVDPTYQTNGRVDAILSIGDTTYIGGNFTAVRPAGAPAGSQQTTRQHLAAFSRSTGALLPWNPGTDKEVLALTASLDGTTVYVGGTFARLGGQSRGRLAQVDAVTGAVLPWAPRADFQVNTVAVTPTLIYFGGTFDSVNGQARSRLAAVDYSGVLSSTWTPVADDRVRVIEPAPDGLSVFVGGDFLSINGDTRQKILVRLDPATGLPLPWLFHPGYPIHSIMFSADTLYAGGDGSGGHVGAFVLATGARLWTLQTDGGVQAMVLAGGVLYVGGHYDNVCVGVIDGATTGFKCPVSQAVRHKLLAIDPVSGDLDPWDPGANSPLGIFSMAFAGSSLMVGGDFTKIGNPDQLGQATHPQQGFGQFTAPS
jgi:outer membrane protein assembly factor BamB